MNLLRHFNSGRNILSLGYRQNLLIPISFDSPHVDNVNNRYQFIGHISRSMRPVVPILPNKLNAVQKCWTHHSKINPNDGFLQQFRKNLDPYKRLIRFDRPIGKFDSNEINKSHYSKRNYFCLKKNRFLAPILAMRMEYCIKCKCWMFTRHENIGFIRLRCFNNAWSWLHNQ